MAAKTEATSPRRESIDSVTSYMKQVGNIPRLTLEEELYYTKSYDIARRELYKIISHFPALIFQIINVKKFRDSAGKTHSLISPINAEIVSSAEFKDFLKEISSSISENFLENKANSQKLRENAYDKINEKMLNFYFSEHFYAELFSKLEETEMLFNANTPDIEKQHSLTAKEFHKYFEFTKEELANMNTFCSAIIEGNLRLVISITRSYNRNGVHMLDLIQEGNIGLMTAVSRFDYKRGYSFSTYATWWIRQSVAKAATDFNRIIRIPANMINTIQLIKRTEKKLLQELGRAPTIEEMSTHTELSQAKIAALLKMTQQPISLQTIVDNEDQTQLAQFIPDKSSEPPDELASSSLLKEALKEVLETLTDREKKIIYLRFGLDNNKIHTLEEIAGIFSISRERIRQLEVIALKKLKHPDRQKYLDGYDY